MRKQGRASITFLPQQRDASFELNCDVTVLDVALAAHLPLNHSCGGMGSCGTCRVVVESDLTQLSERTEIEQERAEELNFSEQERLACQLLAHPGLKVRIPE